MDRWIRPVDRSMVRENAAEGRREEEGRRSRLQSYLFLETVNGQTLTWRRVPLHWVLGGEGVGEQSKERRGRPGWETGSYT